MKSSITIVEVGPRDGLQNEAVFVPTAQKIQFIHDLIDSGIRNIEVTSFVSPKWVPQMADHETLMKQFASTTKISYSALVPNQKGLQHALACQVKRISIFTAASDTFSQKNTGRSLEQSLQDYDAIIRQAKQFGLFVRGYISCALGCPYEGKIPLAQVARVAHALQQSGCDEIALGDTIGVGTPSATRALIHEITSFIPIEQLAVHFHDTYGQALANILVALEMGIATVDSSVAGLGGCPYAKGASGNVATEEIVYMLHGMGINTGIDLDKLIDAGETICRLLEHPSRSKVALATLAKRQSGESRVWI